MTGKVQVAAIGTGYFSQFHYDAWARIGDAEIVAICDLNEEQASTVASQFDGAPTFTELEAMLDETKPDLVDIITPPPTHPAFIQATVARGIPAICQKPFCPTFKEAETMAEAAEEAGALVVVHENFRFQPWYEEIHRQIESGALGRVYQANFRLRPGDGQGPEAYLGRQPYFQKMPRFLIHETAIHMIDVFRYLFGEPDFVTADLRRLNPAISGEDAGIVILDFGSGVRAVFDGNRLVDHAAENRRLTIGEMTVEGSDAVLRLDGDGRLHLRRHGENEETELRYDWAKDGFAGDSVIRLQRHVVDHLRHGTPVVNAATDYLRNLQLEEAVYDSDRLGRRLAV